DLPAFERCVEAGLEAALLLVVAHREPVLDEVDAVLDQHAFEGRALAQEELVLLLGAEPHHPLDARPVVPAAVEQDDLTAGGEIGDVALEVPLGLLLLGGGGEGGDTTRAGAEVLGDALDHAALAGRVAAFEDDEYPLLLLPDPLLELHQLDLQSFELGLVDLLRQLVRGCHGLSLPGVWAPDARRSARPATCPSPRRRSSSPAACRLGVH